MTMKDTVYLLGKGDGWDKVYDIQNRNDVEVWGVNDACLRTPGLDKTFHMHDLYEFSHTEPNISSTKLFVDYCNEHPEMEVFTVKSWEKIPHLKEYPVDEIIEYFNLPIPYFTSGPEYMIAYAIYKGFKNINYLGLNMTVKQEYIDQKPGMEFWTGVALGKGCNVNLQHDTTSIMKTRDSLLYGYLIKQWRIY